MFADSLKLWCNTPVSVDIEKVVNKICKLGKVKNVGHVHVWQLNVKEKMFEAQFDFHTDIFMSEVVEKLDEYDLHHNNMPPEYSVSNSKILIHEN